MAIVLEPPPVAPAAAASRDALSRALGALPLASPRARAFRFPLHGRRGQEILAWRVEGAAGGGEPLRVGVFAGLHGDEPAGVLASAELVLGCAAEPARALGYELWFVPLCNPGGFAAGTRESPSGADLNREFWRGSPEPEVRVLEDLLLRLRFHGIISLHSDDTCDGVYGFASGATLTRDILEPALRAASGWIPRDARPVIDDFAAEGSIITDTYPGVLSAPPGASPRPFEIVFETPQVAALDLQVRATVAAVGRMLDEYRAFLGQAINL